MAAAPKCEGSEVWLDIITPAQAVITEYEGLVSYLRQQLSNPAIVIKTKLTETPEQASSAPFTSKQKLEVMLNDNKSLKNMIEKFGLSFDY